MIIVECNTDKYYITNLGFPKRLIKHESCKGDVIRKIIKNSGYIGIVDEDPDSNQPSEMNNFQQIERKNDITLFQRKDNENIKLIQISPNLESWFIKRARNNGINPHDYDLADTFDSLHVPHIEKRHRFKEFLYKLVSVDEEGKQLKKWLIDAER